ncbi:MAG: [Clostridia bacterium]|nr:[FeFe] hydrogenase H-cluster maturation GTPase HydF [Clostridia bacterium]
MNNVVSAERVHIGFFGLRNAGKSSVVNALTGQELAVVSDVKGTTTDPVQKAMELLPLGPVVIIDTPGIDDEGELGLLRVQKTKQILRKTDAAVLVSDARMPLGEEETALCRLFEQMGLPYVIVRNKIDLDGAIAPNTGELAVSAKTGEGIEDLKETLARLVKSDAPEKTLLQDLVGEGDTVVLVTPIDGSAPKGRLILPQQQTVRELLDRKAVAVVTQVETLSATLDTLGAATKLVITDSQAFAQVSPLVPDAIPLTSFSILFARYKGNFASAVKGAAMLDRLQDGDKVLISEGCTHHRQCGDIGTVKLPRLIRRHTGKDVLFSFTSGGDFPEDLQDYALVIHCGGCMLNEREMRSRMRSAREQEIPMTNYGMAIAHMNGILHRSLSLFSSEL